MRLRDAGKVVVTAVLALTLGVAPALAGDRGGRGHDHYNGGRHDRGDWGRGDHRDGRRGPDYRYGGPPPSWHGHGGHSARRWHGGYGHYRRDDDALLFLGLAAITLIAVGSMSEAQQRAHENAQIRATGVPIGQPVIWSDGSSSGSVTPLREGRTPAGAYCREFQQQVTIGGRTEDAYGTACQQPDGSWQVVG